MGRKKRRNRNEQTTESQTRREFKKIVDFSVYHGFCYCYLCGMPILPGQHYNLDHVHPVSRGGATSFDNLRPAHYDCNQFKADKDPTPEVLVQIYLSMQTKKKQHGR